MRVFHAALVASAMSALGACAPSIPDSGIGFDNSIEAQRARDAALAGGGTITGDPLIPPAAVSSETLDPVGAPLSATAADAIPDPAYDPAAAPTAVAAAPDAVAPSGSGTAEDIARETAAALAAASTNSGVAPVQASPSNPAPPIVGNPGLSDENDFAAVSNRETIQSDAERLAGLRQSYEQVQPTAVPERPGGGSPNVVAFALSTSNPVGARVYSRTGFNLDAKAVRNCGKYPSPDQAQIAFLSAGGPQRDKLGLDPDGDGFACGWDPRPFRQAARSN